MVKNNDNMYSSSADLQMLETVVQILHHINKNFNKNYTHRSLYCPSAIFGFFPVFCVDTSVDLCYCYEFTFLLHNCQ